MAGRLAGQGEDHGRPRHERDGAETGSQAVVPRKAALGRVIMRTGQPTKGRLSIIILAKQASAEGRANAKADTLGCGACFQLRSQTHSNLFRGVSASSFVPCRPVAPSIFAATALFSRSFVCCPTTLPEAKLSAATTTGLNSCFSRGSSLTARRNALGSTTIRALFPQDHPKICGKLRPERGASSRAQRGAGGAAGFPAEDSQISRSSSLSSQNGLVFMQQFPHSVCQNMDVPTAASQSSGGISAGISNTTILTRAVQPKRSAPAGRVPYVFVFNTKATRNRSGGCEREHSIVGRGVDVTSGHQTNFAICTSRAIESHALSVCHRGGRRGKYHVGKEGDNTTF